VHVFQTGSPEIRKYLDFRDYLMEHPDEARAYEQLKLDLAGRYPHNSDGYTQGKDAFIRGILHRAELWREGKSALEEREIYGKTES
jgi:GrpB-like predicted nucleotidyltransferase (UPF0157 family)